MERLLCLIIGYVFGMFQTGFIYGKINHIRHKRARKRQCRNNQCSQDSWLESRIYNFCGRYIKGGSGITCRKTYFP